MAIANTQRSGTAAPADAQAVEFGAALRQTRLSHGRDLADVARQLRIRQPYLQAIEDGRFEDLPGPTYAIGFVRAYADYLGLEEGEVVKRYKELRGGASAPANLVPPAPVTEGRLPTGPLLLLAAILAAAAYGGWYYLSMEGRDPGEVVAALPDRIAAMVGMKRDTVPGQAPDLARTPAPPPADTAPAGEPAAPPAVSPSPAQTPAAESTTTAPPAAGPAPATPPVAGTPSDTRPAGTPAETGTSTAQPAAPAAAAPEAAPAAPPAAPGPTAAAPPPSVGTFTETPPPVPGSAPPAAAVPAPPAPPAAPDQMAARGEAGPPARVIVRAEASSWVEIRNAEDRRVFSRLMRAGETYAVPPTPGLSLTTGNAGGLSLVVDGRTLPPLGRTGDVRRDLALDAETLLRTSGSAP